MRVFVGFEVCSVRVCLVVMRMSARLYLRGLMPKGSGVETVLKKVRKGGWGG